MEKPSGNPFDQALTDPLVVSYLQRHRGPEHPHWKIPPAEWPAVLRRVEQGEPLRKIAREYHVSYETIRRVVRAVRLLQAG
jgi:DNA-binding NarL/FixJ family response regulator